MTVVPGYPQHAVHGFGGAAAAGGSLAAAAAGEVLRGGGNAVDAVVAGALVQAVAEVPAGGLGGDAFILVRTAGGDTHAVNGSGRSPVALASAVEAGRTVPRFGPLSVAVPGFVGAVHAAQARFGAASFNSLVEPAISYAREGFPMTAELAESAERVLPDLAADSALRGLLEGNGLEVGSRFRQPELARTLEAIAEQGPGAFYSYMGEKMALALADRGGVLSADDMAGYEPAWVEPVSLPYRGLRIFTHPPVSLGTVLLFELGVYERLGLTSDGHDDPRRIDAMVRCKRAGFTEATGLLRDSDLGDDGAALLLAEERMSAWAERILDMPLHEIDGVGAPSDGADTTCIVAADSEGNMAALIHSLFNEFGSRELDEASGVLLNDRLANQRVELDGVGGVAPGARPLHTLNAALVTTGDGRPAMMAATPGGRGQVQTLFQVIANTFDDGLDVQAAIDAPRWLSGAPRRPEPNDQLYMEPGVAAETVTALESRGHRVTLTDAEAGDLYGSCTAVGCSAAGSLYAAADRRRGARAIAF